MSAPDTNRPDARVVYRHALAEENERLRKALREIAEVAECDVAPSVYGSQLLYLAEIARAAMGRA